ncbi:ATP synthase F1 subunit delta [Patescibacteria group bacterium]
MKTKNSKATQVTRGLIEYLKKSGQLNILPQLVKETLRKSQIESDPSLAVITTAVKLTSQEQSQIKKTLSKVIGVEMKVKNVVNQGVIAGMHVKIGDKVIDNTIQNKITKLGEKLAQ